MQYLPDELTEQSCCLPIEQAHEGTIANRLAARAESRVAGRPCRQQLAETEKRDAASD